jgi:hypothetical protein
MDQGFSAIVGSGTVAPATFVTFMGATQPALLGSTTATSPYNAMSGYYVMTCNQGSVAGDIPCGISQIGTRGAPTIELQTSYAGQYTGAAGYTGDPIQVRAQADRGVLLVLGSSCNPGVLLMPDASGGGTGVPATVGNYYGALTEEGGTAGQPVRVTVVIGKA